MEQERALLAALKAALRGQTVDWEEMTPQEWRSLLRLAAIHNVRPLVLEAVYGSAAYRRLEPALQLEGKKAVIREVAAQAARTDGFARLYGELRRQGIEPLVVKGMVCRSLYPQPDARPSGDEDWLIDPAQFDRCDALLCAQGMRRMDPEKDPAAEFEISYLNPALGLHLELHKALFEPGSGALKDFNDCFAGAAQRAVTRQAGGIPVRTLNGQDHLLYLLLHAFKHFIHSGFGIRQICDIVLWAEEYGRQIDWERLLEQCRSLGAADFAAAVFKIGEQELGFDTERAGYPACWRGIPVDAAPMLQDILAGGVYGGAQENRQHSSTMTVNAVEAARSDKKTSVWQSVFPAARQLEGRYPYLKQHPAMLPVAWADRLVKYGGEVFRSAGQENAAASIQIGQQRIELLRQYKIIE